MSTHILLYTTGVFKHDPKSYTPLSRSPCWQDGYSFRCIAQFYIAGFSKPATRDLYNRLARHPDIIADNSEVHWFDFWRNIAGYDSIETYAGYFPNASGQITRDIVDHGYSDKLVGDATPSTAWSSLYWRCYQGNKGQRIEPLYTNADIIYRLNPKAKIIFIMSDPVERDGYLEDLTLKLWTRAVPNAFTRWSLHLSPASDGAFDNGQGEVVLTTGHFMQRRWDYKKECTVCISRIGSLRFPRTNCSSSNDPGVEWYIDRSYMETNTRTNSRDSILPETKEALGEFYPFVNSQLPNLLSDSRFRW
ncbi:carbohydrate sulfotransferase 15-like protein [Plakobranchus ocellatus]|uniref:Carbohydrate sulfotransferase 15-like protein n=1 Tax=Plakobranchus ocellatus TaxID=259542 RepID=A0AAV3ZNP3_9GAST|nr:carbohydrate sulfotransferase 15-like protein [Plakobranchus ocellatus]